ncbi:hypothetical protein PT974_07052 [Cladobotryum mycophilum]|uniref:Uncharacterized protein n=1 Tax=Cladobotryum mycophilum TaxID=491253 RepID=A0ABR0SNE6_9HYPO
MSDSTSSETANAPSILDTPLANDIVKSTRKVHAEVNKLVVARLPLALPLEPLIRALMPPACCTWPPSTQPLRPYGNISLTSRPKAKKISCSLARMRGDVSTEPRPVVNERVYAILERIYIPGLVRSSRLKADICDMTGWSPQVYDEQLKNISETGEVAKLIAHIKEIIHDKPYILISYSYLIAGNDFWSAVPGPIKPTMQPCEQNTIPMSEREPASLLSPDEIAQSGEKSHAEHVVPMRFLHFGTLEDGEDLKREYKEKLFDVEENLTPEERQEIIEESRAIFERIALIIGQLDELLQGPDNKGFGSSLPISLLNWFKNPMGSRLRDSVAVTRERRSARNSKYSSGGGSDASSSNATTTTTAVTTPPKDHPEVAMGEATLADIEKCPGIPKSMRFSKSLPLPPRGHPSTSSTGAGSLKMKSQGLRDAVATGVAGWAMFAALGLMLLGAYFSVLPGSMRIAA